jgi:hypothetical protein
VIYDYANPDSIIGNIDTIFLLDALSYPILLGKENPEYIPPDLTPTLQKLATSEVRDLGINVFNPATLPEIKESRNQRKKRLRTEQDSQQRSNIADKVRRSERLSSVTNLASVPKEAKWEELVANTVYSWALDNIPDELWQSVEDDTIQSSSVNLTSTSSFHYANEPRSHTEAMKRVSEKELWSAAEDREYNALVALNFADVVDIPQDRVTIPVMWVYKYKTNELGLRTLYKARLVVRGDKSIEGFDYFETFAPVAKIDSIRLVLAMIITHQLLPLQLDIDNAFVQSDLAETVYIQAIPGRPLPPGKCYKLNCALYGLKQAGRNWNSKCSSYFIDELGFIQLRNDLCVFIFVWIVL